MQKIKEYKGIIIIVLVLILGIFYWYEWRPSHLVKKCQFWSINKTEEIQGDRIDALYFYKKCLREYGFDR